MTKITTFFMMLAISLVGFSQQEVVQDFENGGLGEPFGEASASLVEDPDGGTNGQVAMLTSNPAGTVWQGINISLSDNVDLTTDKSMSMDVYSNSPITIAPKVVSGVDGAPDSTTSASHSGSGWETLSFTFDQGLDNTTTANGVYGAFVIYYNWDGDANNFGSQDDRVFYVDNIKGIPAEESTEPVGNPPSTAAPTPPATPDNEIISFYSDAYAQQPLNFDAGFCGFDSTEEIQIEGNNTIKYLGNACQGIILDSPVDASSFTTLHFDFYVEEGTDLLGSVISLKLNQTNGEGPDDDIFLDNVLTEGSTPPIVTGEWVSVEIPVDLTDFDALDEVVITAGTLSNAMYYDNFYLSGGTLSNADFATAEFKAYPNPSSDNWTIDVGSNTIKSIQVYDLTGKMVLETAGNNQSKVQINASNLNRGVYLANIVSDGNSKSIKLIKK